MAFLSQEELDALSPEERAIFGNPQIGGALKGFAEKALPEQQANTSAGIAGGKETLANLLKMTQVIPNIASELSTFAADENAKMPESVDEFIRAMLESDTAAALSENIRPDEGILDFLGRTYEMNPTAKAVGRAKATVESDQAKSALGALGFISDLAAIPTPIGPAAATAKGITKAGRAVSELLRPAEQVASDVTDVAQPTAKQLDLFSEPSMEEPTGQLRLFTDSIDETAAKAQRGELPMPEDAIASGKPVDPQGSVGEKLPGKIADGSLGVTKHTIGRAISTVRHYQDVSPSMRKVADMIEHEPMSGPVKTVDFTEGVASSAGPLMRKLVDVFDRLSNKETRAMAKLLAGEKLLAKETGNFDSVRLFQSSKRVRDILDDAYRLFREAYREGGGNPEDIKYLENYFPQVWRSDVVRKRPQELQRILEQHGFNPVDAAHVVQRLMQKGGALLDMADVIDEEGKLLVGKAANTEMMRKLKNVPTRQLMDAGFLENDARSVLPRYIHDLVRRAEFIRRFGVHGEKLESMLAKGQEEMLAAGVSPERVATTLKDTRRLVNALQGLYKPIEHSGARKFTAGMLTYQFLRTLTFAQLASAAEPLIVMSRAGAIPALREIPKLIDAFGRNVLRSAGLKRLPKSEAQQFVEDLLVGLDESAFERLNAMYGTGDVLDASKAARLITNKWFKLIGLTQWTQANRAFAGAVVRRIFMREAEKLANTGSKAARKRLLDIGIDPDKAVDWIRRGKPMDDPFYMRDLRGAALRFVNDTVMNPRPAVRPLWMSDHRLALLSQLKSFQVTFGNTVLKRWLNEVLKEKRIDKVPDILITVMAMLGTMMAVNELRDKLQGINRRETFEQKVFRAADKAGMFGGYQLPIDMYIQAKHGGSAIETSAGPAISQLGGAIRDAGRGRPEKIVREAIPVVSQVKPLQKALGLRKK